MLNVISSQEESGLNSTRFSSSSSILSSLSTSPGLPKPLKLIPVLTFVSDVLRLRMDVGSVCVCGTNAAGESNIPPSLVASIESSIRSGDCSPPVLVVLGVGNTKLYRLPPPARLGVRGGPTKFGCVAVFVEASSMLVSVSPSIACGSKGDIATARTR